MLEGIPNEWKQDSDINEIFITCYRMMRLGQKDFDEIRSYGLIFEDIGIAIWVSHGDIRYPDQEIEFGYDEEKDISKCRVGYKIDEISNTPVLFTYSKIPSSKNGKSFKSIARMNTDTVIGLLEIKFGRNQIFEKVFETYLDLKTGESIVDSDLYLNPDIFPKPDLSKENFDDFEALFDLLQKNTESSRLMLALRVYKKALFESLENKFFDYWLALEVLAMPNKDDKISAIQERLAKIYGLSVDDVIGNHVFLIRELYTLRRHIVHRGYKYSLDYNVEQYMQALFKDLFYDSIGHENLMLSYKLYEENRQQLSKLLSI